jgi:hypothetical protein
LGNKIEKNVMGGACSAVREERSVYRVLVEKPERKKPLGRPRCRWEDNIVMNLHGVGYGLWTGSSWFRIETGGGHLKMW